MPTPRQERALEVVLSRCRTLYNCALQQRKTWWGRGQGIGASYYQQAMELPDLKAACPEYAEVHSQVLQDVLRRVIAVPPAFTSQDCSGVLPDGNRCPQRVAKSLSVRTHVCPCCGLVLDRDENAARNMLRACPARSGSGGAGRRAELRSPCL
jgi:hypothetical protein